MCNNKKSIYSNTLKSYIDVPCGRCSRCVDRSINGWVFRGLQELKVSDSAHFVTLTYGPWSVPRNSRRQLYLRRKDLTDYWKRLRDYHYRSTAVNVSSRRLKYIACGEYGDKNGRPHFHAIIYNSHVQYINKAWQRKGNVYIDSDVNAKNIAYTLKYIQKQIVGPKKRHWPKDHEGKPAKPYRVMSKGIGINYLDDPQIIAHHKKFENNFVILGGKYKVAMPKYYRDKILDDGEKEDALAFIQQKVFEKDFDLMCKWLILPENLEMMRDGDEEEIKNGWELEKLRRVGIQERNYVRRIKKRNID